MQYLTRALFYTTTMGGARHHSTMADATIAKMDASPPLPPSSASQWWANAPLQQIDLKKIFDGPATTRGLLCDERTNVPGTNAHQAPLPGPNKSAVEKPKASPPNQLTRFATSSKQTCPFLNNLKTLNKMELGPVPTSSTSSKTVYKHN